MNVNRILAMLEEHVEKGILGLAVLFLVAMVWMYLVRSPNRIEFQGRELGPRELAQAVYEEAQGLENRLRGATAPEPQVEKFAERLRALHERGVLASAEPTRPPLPGELPLSAPLGRPIRIEGLEELEGRRGTVAIITPGPPSSSVFESGRSEVVREPLDVLSLAKLGPGALRGPAPAQPQQEQPKTAEVSWVTLAAYYDSEADAQRMKQAGYASYRTRVYLAGTEIQRQELQPGGIWSDWQTVQVTEAMPRLNLPKPDFDPRTGRLRNRAEIARVFQAVQQLQPLIAEPPFYVVRSGDEWQIPELPDLEEPQLASGRGFVAGGMPLAGGRGPAVPAPQPPPAEAGRSPGLRRPPAPPAQPGGRFTGTGGRGGAPGTGGAVFGGPRQPSEADLRREQTRQYRQYLEQARQAAKDKNWASVRELASRMLQLDKVSKRFRRQAEQILAKAERELAGGAGGRGGRFTPTRSGDGRSRREMILPALLRNRETGEVAVWFHDDTVQPGRVYRYRMRVLLWNRYLGVPRPLKNPEDARKVVLAGQWSEPTEPLEVRALSYFFVQGRKSGEPAARVEVWRLHKGAWLKQSFDVAVGDVVGKPVLVETDELDDELKPKEEQVDFSTGAVVLDIRFDDSVRVRQTRRDGSFSYSRKPSVTIVYLDPGDGTIHEHTQVLDRGDPARKWLEQQASEEG